MINWLHDWIKIKPSDYLYGLTGTHYFSPNLASLSATSTLTNVFDNLKTSSDNLIPDSELLTKTAHNYGLKPLVYEGGPETAVIPFDRSKLELLLQANRDPGIRCLIVHDLYANWYAHPEIHGGLYIYFTLQSGYNRNGMWGLTDDINNLNTPKFGAIRELRGLEPTSCGQT